MTDTPAPAVGQIWQGNDPRTDDRLVELQRTDGTDATVRQVKLTAAGEPFRSPASAAPASTSTAAGPPAPATDTSTEGSSDRIVFRRVGVRVPHRRPRPPCARGSARPLG